MSVLAAAAGLAYELAFRLDRVAYGLAVGHLRRTHVGLHLELALHAVDDDVEVQLAHAGDDGLAGLLVGGHPERRILLGQLLQGDAHLLLVGLGLGLHGDRDHRLRELHALQRDHLLGIAQRVTGGDILEADGGGDIAGAHFLDFLAAVGVHLQDTADALLLALHRVVDRVAGLQHAGIDAEEGQVADKRVGGDLERQCGERRVIG